jgi:hypothetical protein
MQTCASALCGLRVQCMHYEYVFNHYVYSSARCATSKSKDTSCGSFFLLRKLHIDCIDTMLAYLRPSQRFTFTKNPVGHGNKGPVKGGRKRTQKAKRTALWFARLTLDNNHTEPLKSAKTWKYQKLCGYVAIYRGYKTWSTM